MIYTIAQTKEVCKDNPLTLSIEKSGNRYVVELMNTAHETTRRSFDTLMDAYKVYEKIASWFVFGCYSESDRRSFLATGTMR